MAMQRVFGPAAWRLQLQPLAPASGVRQHASSSASCVLGGASRRSRAPSPFLATPPREATSSSSPSRVLVQRRNYECDNKRLQEFLEAEVTHFALMPRKALTLEDLLNNAASPLRTARLVHQEIPRHFAARMRQIEQLEGWRENEQWVDLHNRYKQSFQEMRMINVEEDLGSFTQAVRDLKTRQRKVLTIIGEALKARSEEVQGHKRTFWKDWLTRFLLSRIGTEMLTSQYIAIINQVEREHDSITGIVDPECDPAVICRNAGAAAVHLATEQLGSAPEVKIDVRMRRNRSQSFSYIPYYLHYIVLEVLKNCTVATVENSMLSSISLGDALERKPIHIVICSDAHRVAIRISDLAGGIPFEVGERVWDYGFSGNHVDEEPTALSGYGLGLPLARLYAQYLGGSLSLVSLPEYGVDTYLFLPRIDAPGKPPQGEYAVDH